MLCHSVFYFPPKQNIFFAFGEQKSQFRNSQRDLKSRLVDGRGGQRMTKKFRLVPLRIQNIPVREMPK